MPGEFPLNTPRPPWAQGFPSTALAFNTGSCRSLRDIIWGPQVLYKNIFTGFFHFGAKVKGFFQEYSISSTQPLHNHVLLPRMYTWPSISGSSIFVDSTNHRTKIFFKKIACEHLATVFLVIIP
jgi:hypothetical protein